MALESIVDQETGRKCYLDLPSDYSPGEEVIFILSLHGGGSVGAWQRELRGVRREPATTLRPFHALRCADSEHGHQRARHEL